MKEEISFKNLKELYNRVLPALRSKSDELARLGHDYIKEVDVWNYLVKSAWKNKKNINLYDLVSDILSVENDLLIEHIIKIVKNNKRSALFEGEEDIL